MKFRLTPDGNMILVEKLTIDLCEVGGFGPTLLNRIAKEFPRDQWRDSPYALTRVRGVGFQRADAVALASGIRRDSAERINAAAWHVLGEYEQAGNTAMPTTAFGRGLAELLQIRLPSSIDFDDSIYDENGLISRRSTTRAERVVADNMDRLLSWQGLPPPHPPREAKLNVGQTLALRVIERSNLFALLGGPGVGKTYLVEYIARAVGAGVALCAPTGKAAKRIEELSGIEAKTIHRLLSVVHPEASDYRNHPPAHSNKFRFRHNRDHPLECKLVIVDESSMVDIKLMADLCEALGSARLILVGDPFQLPSVGPGAVLRDLTVGSGDGSGGTIPNMELTELHRQNASQLLARNCHSIRYDKRIILDNRAASDFFFFPSDDPQQTAQAVVDFAVERLPKKYGLNPCEVMVLAPLREKGPLSVKALNLALRARLNPQAANYVMPWLGDRVIQRSNDYDLEIFNGDCGTIVDVADDGKITVLFDTPQRELTAERDEFDLDLAYALTIHKSQGSEWKAVIVVIDGSHPAQYLADGQLTYTAISRAREVCVCIGSRRALDAQVARHRAILRWTRLQTMMRG